MATSSLRQITQYKPLYRCDVEELAAMQIARPSSGVLFARNPDREQKDAARQKVIDLFTRTSRPEPLSILTMPGFDWRFERKLLGKREGDWMRKIEPERTSITAIENDRYIYYSAVHRMPGLHTKRALTTILRPVSFAERTVQTKFIKNFHFANVDDLMNETDQQWDAVWLDYIGPLTVERLRLIARFYERSVRETLIVTALKARYTKETSAAIDRAGGHSEWVRSRLPGRVVHDIEYFDTCPMAQIAISKGE